MSSKIKPTDAHNFIGTCISIDQMMKKVNNHYMEVGYPVIKGFQTDCTNIHKFDFFSKSSIDTFEASKEYKNLRESIENPEVEIFVDRLLEDAKTGTMPFNNSSLTTEATAKRLISTCIAIGNETDIDKAEIGFAKKLYGVCGHELQTYQQYICSVLKLIYSNESKGKEDIKKPKEKSSIQS